MMGHSVVFAAETFLYACTGLTTLMVIGGLPRPWKNKKQRRQGA